MRSLLRRYPDFPDMRAGLAAALWGQGLEGQAESNWCAVIGSQAHMCLAAVVLQTNGRILEDA